MKAKSRKVYKAIVVAGRIAIVVWPIVFPLYQKKRQAKKNAARQECMDRHPSSKKSQKDS